MLAASGSYLPEGILPYGSEVEKEDDGPSEFCPVYVTKTTVLGNHAALFLFLFITRPDLKLDLSKFNIHALAKPL